MTWIIVSIVGVGLVALVALIQVVILRETIADIAIILSQHSDILTIHSGQHRVAVSSGRPASPKEVRKALLKRRQASSSQEAP